MTKLALTVFMFACFTAMGVEEAEQTATHRTKIHPVRVAGGSLSDLGFKLFQSLYEGRKGSNPIAVSPMSIAEALTLTTYGAKEDTRKQLESLFISERMRKLGVHFDMLADNVVGIREDLKKFASESNDAFQYSSATALWANNREGVNFKYKPEFLKVANSRFQSTKVREEDFSAMKEVDGKEVNATVWSINDFVAKETRQKITKILEQLQPTDCAVLVNAIYAKGKFLNTFTVMKEGDYTDARGKESRVTMMTKKEKAMRYYSDNVVKAYSFQIADAKKGNKNAVALDILVPQNGAISDLVKELDAEYYERIALELANPANRADIELSAPAGEVKQQEAAKLKDVLRAAPFNVDLPFSKSAANFKALGTVSDKNAVIYINDVLTKTFYAMTPLGFEAAAATAVIFAFESTALPEEPKWEKHTIDSASIHVVRHVASGAPLFIVEYDTPKKYSEKEMVELIEEAYKGHQPLRAEESNGESIGVSYDNNGPVVARLNKKHEVIQVLKKLPTPKR